jgi:hypothetical protein
MTVTNERADRPRGGHLPIGDGDMVEACSLRVAAAAHRPLFIIEIAPIIFVADVKMIERSPTPHILALHDLPLRTSRAGRLHRLAELLLADGHLEQ